jgi:two-component system, NarL family, invasion response regulator UvrY
MEPTTIMIVDDHPLLRDTWAKFLCFHGNFKIVATTGDGAEAIKLAKELKPDLILLDINMAPVSGFDVLLGIQELSSKVIAVSMHAEANYATKALKYGARAYLTKNAASSELICSIAEVLAGNIYICNEIKLILAFQTVKGNNLNHNRAFNIK